MSYILYTHIFFADITSPLRVKQRFDDANQRVEALISSKQQLKTKIQA